MNLDFPVYTHGDAHDKFHIGTKAYRFHYSENLPYANNYASRKRTFKKDFSLLVELPAKFFKVNRYSGSSFCHLIGDMVNCHLIIELEVWTVAADTGQLDGYFSSPRLSDYAVVVA